MRVAYKWKILHAKRAKLFLFWHIILLPTLLMLSFITFQALLTVYLLIFKHHMLSHLTSTVQTMRRSYL